MATVSLSAVAIGAAVWETTSYMSNTQALVFGFWSFCFVLRKITCTEKKVKIPYAAIAQR